MNAPLSSSNDRMRRLGRLILKELREILRDRRTIVTLVLMPLLVYPLLSVAFKQFFVSQLRTSRPARYKVGYDDKIAGEYVGNLLLLGGAAVVNSHDEPAAARHKSDAPLVAMEYEPDLAEVVQDKVLHLGVRLAAPHQALHLDPRKALAAKIELLYHDDWNESREAAGYVERCLSLGNEKFLDARLRFLRVNQSAPAIEVVRHRLENPETTSVGISITSVVPFILILMTITGAVYPAIDLTAGERERGTLEVLVAAPIPRLGVLLAKYVAVLTVALLTATANLLMMTATVLVGGFGNLLFGEAGLSAGAVAAVLALLLLFASFFSAVLLAITSTARSFKEAQAYLIPLMLVALAPGILSLMPDVRLSGLLLVTPLANIVMLGRDLLKLEASGPATAIVVASTLLYAGAAIGVAARVFGAESVLYNSQSGWSDLFRRPRESQPAPTITAATFCLAFMLPAYILLFDLLGQWRTDIVYQQLAGVLMTAAVFGVIPLLACGMRRVKITPAFRLPRMVILVFASSVILGLSFWVVTYEAVQLVQSWRGVQFDQQTLSYLRAFADSLRSLPLPLTLVTMALVPAFFEEWFFRGYLFSAFQTRTTTATAIVVTAIAFGLFHAINPNPLAPERVVSTTLTGLLLGWVRWRTGSVFPGMALHAVNNALVFVPVYYEPQLAALGIGSEHTEHLPALWIGGGVTLVGIGASMLVLSTRSRVVFSEAEKSK